LSLILWRSKLQCFTKQAFSDEFLIFTVESIIVHGHDKELGQGYRLKDFPF